MFAVNLFDVEESNITVGNGARLTALGSPAKAERPPGTARDEWWVPLAVVVLALLMIEWLVYERDGVRRLVARGRPLLHRPRLRRRGA